mmetsp:Transcript_20070/g.26295  ORF Transcript_20070/g.26295 Transcript_20070/m.26295 type:complete len:251 (+) Transcript_20070:44-796(+)|eukprot:CAMPEP_0195291866 /NCGR_PEP_ID=MMETSP0707-20130614/8419_1 /TAXON_ID=33640 /ORGANISM="Asterionellopsis glacialis, Strain CCMP134" /LENGTH=250 /DNA_ID=CAMNT_0040352219 /DNA_START=70 /DNA_END=822 /DNA_ORIENTATION=+
MTSSYEDVEQKYNASVSRIRSFLAATRSQSTLKECQRLFGEARQCALQLNEMSQGNPTLVEQAKNRLERELVPLEQEINRTSTTVGAGGGQLSSSPSSPPNNMFYQPPQEDSNYWSSNSNGGLGDTTEQLIQSSEDLLRESQALCVDSELVGNSTLEQMTRQREQLQISMGNANDTRGMVMEARRIMTNMGRKALKNKLFLYFVIFILIVMNVMAFLHVLRQKFGSSSNNNNNDNSGTNNGDDDGRFLRN